MQISMYTNSLTQDDFSCIGNVARHCDLSKLCIAVEESKTFDIIPLFCYEFVADVLEKWGLGEDDADYEKYTKLINGGDYVVGSKSYYNIGLKRVWVYYAYARYLLINQFNDTANGTVQKTNEFSIPTSIKEVTDFSNKYRRMGKEAFLSVQGYLCRNSNDFPLFDTCNCKMDCGCSGTCNCGKTKKLTGFKFRKVSR